VISPLEILRLIIECEQKEFQLSYWESAKLADWREQINTGKGLTPDQAYTLLEIWERVTK
jgi:hypothetical protein